MPTQLQQSSFQCEEKEMQIKKNERKEETKNEREQIQKKVSRIDLNSRMGSDDQYTRNNGSRRNILPPAKVVICENATEIRSQRYSVTRTLNFDVGAMPMADLALELKNN